MAEQRLLGRRAAPGMFVGRVSVIQIVRVQARPISTPEEERSALIAALEEAIAETRFRASQATGDAADMLAFQVAMLSDDELPRVAFEAITSGLSAAFAWEAAISAEASVYANGGNTVLAARSADLDDIRDRVLDRLSPGSRIAPPHPGAVIAAADLSLSRFLDADWSQGGAIILTEGSEYSHVAMLARARNTTRGCKSAPGAKAPRPGKQSRLVERHRNIHPFAHGLTPRTVDDSAARVGVRCPPTLAACLQRWPIGYRASAVRRQSAGSRKNLPRPHADDLAKTGPGFTPS